MKLSTTIWNPREEKGRGIGDLEEGGWVRSAPARTLTLWVRAEIAAGQIRLHRTRVRARVQGDQTGRRVLGHASASGVVRWAMEW